MCRRRAVGYVSITTVKHNIPIALLLLKNCKFRIVKTGLNPRVSISRVISINQANLCRSYIRMRISIILFKGENQVLSNSGICTNPSLFNLGSVTKSPNMSFSKMQQV